MTTQTVRVNIGKTTLFYSPKTALMSIMQRNLVEQLPETAISSALQALPDAPNETLRRFRSYLDGVTVPAQDEPSLKNMLLAIDGLLEARP